jgi:hypothetical protein
MQKSTHLHVVVLLQLSAATAAATILKQLERRQLLSSSAAGRADRAPTAVHSRATPHEDRSHMNEGAAEAGIFRASAVAAVRSNVVVFFDVEGEECMEG